jgi:hypothetical protein
MAEVHAMAFLDRLESLDFHELGAAIRRWRSFVDDAWFEAERALAQAVYDTRAFGAQRRVIDRLSDLFRRARWFTLQAPGAVIGASDASGQYVATLAALALLVREALSGEQFKLLYRTFAPLIPLPTIPVDERDTERDTERVRVGHRSTA